MKTVAVVAWREIVEHRIFLAAALAALAVALVVPMVPGFLGWSSSDVREVLMWLMAIGFSWLSALFLGASMVTGTVAEGRFGFFMARPVNSAALWFGKLLGVLAVVLTCQLLVVVPAAMLSNLAELFRSRPGMGWVPRDLLAVGGVVALPALLVLLAHAVATIWRGGTAWVLVDLIAFALTVGIGWASIAPLMSVRAEVAATVVGMLMVGGAAVAVIAAGSVQIADGRCERRRQHRSFSIVLWPLLLLAVAGGVGYSVWLRSPRISDLTSVEGMAVQPSGGWIAVSGPTRSRFDVESSFALDLEHRRSFRLGLRPVWAGGAAAAFSADGQVVAWPVRDGDQWRIRYGALDELPSGVQDSKILLERRPWLVLSPGGGRIALIDGGTLVVTAVTSGDIVGSARIPWGERFAGPYFVDETRVRVLAQGAEATDRPRRLHSGSRISIRSYEFDLARMKLIETGSLTDAAGIIAVTRDQARDRLILHMRLEYEAVSSYVDARTLEVVGWFAERDLGSPVAMLEDGRLVRLARDGSTSFVERLTPDGEIDGRVQLLRSPERVVFGSQPSPSTVAITVRLQDGGGSFFNGWNVLVVDLDAEELREIGANLLPIRVWTGMGSVSTPLPAGCPAARLFFGEEPGLWLNGAQIDDIASALGGPAIWEWRPDTGRMVLIGGAEN